jgi:hypothetical protein
MTPPGWQDIASAPKDGTRVLLAGGHMFCESLEEYVTAPLSAQWNGRYWLIGGTEGGYVCLAVDDPTHWMPLPSIPEEISSQTAARLIKIKADRDDD